MSAETSQDRCSWRSRGGNSSLSTVLFWGEGNEIIKIKIEAYL
jgi:hypothetical protein